ncbi:hypothetical protein LZ30DRAFT_332491 [Colletotrichum cereale]|nr:hypothetical protein LZ30DRAFT_332491 [Colletotrichum cereale]
MVVAAVSETAATIICGIWPRRGSGLGGGGLTRRTQAAILNDLTEVHERMPDGCGSGFGDRCHNHLWYSTLIRRDMEPCISIYRHYLPVSGSSLRVAESDIIETRLIPSAALGKPLRLQDAAITVLQSRSPARLLATRASLGWTGNVDACWGSTGLAGHDEAKEEESHGLVDQGWKGFKGAGNARPIEQGREERELQSNLCLEETMIVPNH